MITPLDNRVLIRKVRMKEKTSGGIFLPESVRKKSEMAEVEVEVVKLGEAAFLSLYIKPEEGDIVFISRYAGADHKNVNDDFEYRIVNDDDITAMKKDINIKETIEGLRNE